MTAITNSQLGVYTIANRTLVLEALTHGGSGELTEGRAWATGLRNLMACMANDQPTCCCWGMPPPHKAWNGSPK